MIRALVGGDGGVARNWVHGQGVGAVQGSYYPLAETSVGFRVVDKIQGPGMKTAHRGIDVASGAIDHGRNIEIPTLQFFEKSQTLLLFEFETAQEHIRDWPSWAGI